jgi:hypothetical protein
MKRKATVCVTRAYLRAVNGTTRLTGARAPPKVALWSPGPTAPSPV